MLTAKVHNPIACACQVKTIERKNINMKNDYKIKTVEFYYNGNHDKFDIFLNSLIRDYLSEDKISPDTEENSDKLSA